MQCVSRGQVRKTRQPYVTHCIETALIVEGLLSPTENDERCAVLLSPLLFLDSNQCQISFKLRRLHYDPACFA